jgi:hypothetical protein
MGKRTKKQHYVPRCYLKRFLNRDGKLFVFDKFTRRSYKTALVNIAHENGFYDLPAPAIAQASPQGGVDPQMAEKALSGIETLFDLELARLVKGADKRLPLHHSQKINLSLNIVRQFLRTKEYRQTLQQDYKKLTQAIADEWMLHNFPEVRKDQYSISWPEEFCPVEQIRSIFNEDDVVELANCLMPHIWIVGTNPTIQPFYTSDHPVVRRASVFAPGRSFTGLRSPGIEITYPITTRHVLILLERSHFQRHARLDGQVIELNAFDVERINRAQVMQSYRQVYCAKPEFEQAAGVCRRYPEVCDSDRKRSHVEVRGDVLALRGNDPRG